MLHERFLAPKWPALALVVGCTLWQVYTNVRRKKESEEYEGPSFSKRNTREYTGGGEHNVIPTAYIRTSTFRTQGSRA